VLNKYFDTKKAMSPQVMPGKFNRQEQEQLCLQIYHLGKEITALHNEEKTAGTYEITWYAENLPSGVYFYRLQAGDFIQTKKMILLK
jgi:hypothetical protein